MQISLVTLAAASALVGGIANPAW